MSKHTGGDWTADTDEIDDCSDVHAEGSEPDGASLLICELHHPNHKADARLIAAAPDLLAALKHMVVEMRNVNDVDWEFVSAAIRKAEGDK